MKRLLLALLALTLAHFTHAQLLTWSPGFPKENDASQTLVITMDANKGNKGLLNYADSAYVHIGVITSFSTSSADWKHVPFQWGTTLPASKATYLGNNKWSYTISGSLRSFFNVTDPAEIIQKIAILFRDGPGSRKQANGDGSDMYIPIYGSGLAARLDLPAREPRFIPVPQTQGWMVGTSFPVQGASSSAADLTLYHNGNIIGSAANATSVSANSTVAATGNQQLVLKATNGSATVYDTINIFAAPASSPEAALPAGLRDGINYPAGDTSAILVLYAPGKNIVTVVGEFNNWTQDTAYTMRKTPDGSRFWLRINGLVPGTEYAFQYRVDDSIRIADPYTHKILDPWNDQYIPAATYPGLKPYPAGQSGIVSLLQTARPGYTWSVNNFARPDKRGLVVYELLLRDFLNNHDWNTLRDTLSYLKTLGINAIELMPVNEFEGNISWGYNPDFYFAPDKYYGPENNLKRFIDSAHSKGIAVIMDMTLNHSFGLSPMVQLYFDRATGRPSASNPWFNPVAKHDFNVGYDMNHESAATQYFTSRVIEHWVKEFKIDGFRFDLSKGFTQTQTCDANGANCNSGAMAAYDASRINIWKRYYDTLQLKAPGTYGILEHFAENSEEKVLSDYGFLLWGNHNYNYIQASISNIPQSNFEGVIHSSRGWTKPHLVGYMESHDEERIMHRNIVDGKVTASYNIRDTATALKRLELNAAFFFTIPGPKMIWQFGELGYDFPINYCPNGTINNNCRVDPKPIRWDYLSDPRRKSVYNTYSKLINLRFHPAYKNVFLAGSVEKDLSGSFKWMRILGDTSHIMVIGNFDVIPQNSVVIFPTPGTWYDHLNNTTITATGATQSITLQPGEFHVYLNRNLAGFPTTAITTLPVSGNRLEARIFPNPAINNFTVDMYIPQTGQTRFELVNATGQELGTLQEVFLQKGRQQRTFTRQGWPRGAYYLRISGRGQQTILPLILQ